MRFRPLFNEAPAGSVPILAFAMVWHVFRKLHCDPGIHLTKYRQTGFANACLTYLLLLFAVFVLANCL